MLAVLFYVFFLWHYIPNSDGGLSSYCERKINSRLAEIVSDKVTKALEEEERKRAKADQKAMRKGEKPVYGRQATLPALYDATDEDKLPSMPMLHRNDTTPTLPLYTSRPGTPSSALPGFELSDLENKRPFASRTGTGSSYTSNAPLLSNASDMGLDRSASPISPLPPLPPLNTSGMPLAPQRTLTNNSAGSHWGSNSPVGPPRGPPRMPPPFGDRGYTQSPVSYADSRSPQSPPTPMDSYGKPMPRAVGDLRSNTPLGPPSSMGARTPFDPYSPNARSSPTPSAPPSRMGARTPLDPYSPNARSSPAPSAPPSRMGARTPLDPYSSNARSSPAPSGPTSDYGRASPASGLSVTRSPPPTNNTSYVAYNPTQRPTPSTPSNAPGPGQQSRSMTDPVERPPPSDYFSSGPQRSATGLSDGTMNGPRAGPARLASPAPYVNNFNGRGSPQGYNQGGANSPSPPRDPNSW
jgi:hypothetical protein